MTITTPAVFYGKFSVSEIYTDIVLWYRLCVGNEGGLILRYDVCTWYYREIERLATYTEWSDEIDLQCPFMQRDEFSITLYTRMGLDDERSAWPDQCKPPQLTRRTSMWFHHRVPFIFSSISIRFLFSSVRPSCSCYNIIQCIEGRGKTKSCLGYFRFNGKDIIYNVRTTPCLKWILFENILPSRLENIML